MPGQIFKNVTGSLIVINETGTEIPGDAEFDIEDHPELLNSHQFKKLISLNFIIKIPEKKDPENDPVKILTTGHSSPIPTETIREIVMEMGMTIKDLLVDQNRMDIDKIASQIIDRIEEKNNMQNHGVMVDKEQNGHGKVSNEGFQVEAMRAEAMNSALKFQSVEDRPAVKIQEEVDDLDDLGQAAKALKRTLQGDA